MGGNLPSDCRDPGGTVVSVAFPVVAMGPAVVEEMTDSSQEAESASQTRIQRDLAEAELLAYFGHAEVVGPVDAEIVDPFDPVDLAEVAAFADLVGLADLAGLAEVVDPAEAVDPAEHAEVVELAESVEVADSADLAGVSPLPTDQGQGWPVVARAAACSSPHFSHLERPVSPGLAADPPGYLLPPNQLAAAAPPAVEPQEQEAFAVGSFGMEVFAWAQQTRAVDLAGSQFERELRPVRSGSE